MGVEANHAPQRYNHREMRRNERRRVFFTLLLVMCLSAFCRLLFAQASLSDWPEYHKKDLARWATKSGRSFSWVKALTEAATEESSTEADPQNLYTIESIDAKTLKKRKQILFSTWDAGTGHCLTLYVLKSAGSSFEKIWQSNDNLCTRSILGAAKTQAMPDGRIIVRYREYSVDSDPAKNALPILRVVITYKWDGIAYSKSRRVERPEPGEGVR